jgi:hypothetical protein
MEDTNMEKEKERKKEVIIAFLNGDPVVFSEHSPTQVEDYCTTVFCL